MLNSSFVQSKDCSNTIFDLKITHFLKILSEKKTEEMTESFDDYDEEDLVRAFANISNNRRKRECVSVTINSMIMRIQGIPIPLVLFYKCKEFGL